MFRRLLCGAVLLILVAPSGGYSDSTGEQQTVPVDVILTATGATLVVCSAVACGICICHQRKNVRRRSDAESPNITENIEMVIRKISVEKGAVSTREDVVDSRTHRQPITVNLVSGSAYDSSCGLGFNVCGDHQTGAVFVSEVLKNGPAKVSGKIHTGDRLLSLKVSTKNMELEDALTILSYAAPYPVEICIQPATEVFRTSKDLVRMSSLVADTGPQTGVRRAVSTCSRPHEATGTAPAPTAADRKRRPPKRSQSETSGHSGARHNVVRLDAEHGVAMLIRRQEPCSSDDDLDLPPNAVAAHVQPAGRSQRVLSDSAIDLVTEISTTELYRSDAEYTTCELHSPPIDSGANVTEASGGEGQKNNRNRRTNQWIVERATKSVKRVANDGDACGPTSKHSSSSKAADDEAAADRRDGLLATADVIGTAEVVIDDDASGIASARNQFQKSDQSKQTKARRWADGQELRRSSDDCASPVHSSARQSKEAAGVDIAEFENGHPHISDENARGVGSDGLTSAAAPVKAKRTSHKQRHHGGRTETGAVTESLDAVDDACAEETKPGGRSQVWDDRGHFQDHARAVTRKHDDILEEQSHASMAATIERPAVSVGFVSARPKTVRHILSRSDDLTTDNTDDDGDSILQLTTNCVDVSRNSGDDSENATISGLQEDGRLRSTKATERASATFVEIDLNDEQTSVKSQSDVKQQKPEVHAEASADDRHRKSSVDVGLKFKNFWSVGSLDRQPKKEGLRLQQRRDSADVSVHQKDRFKDIGIRYTSDDNNNDECVPGRTGYVMARGKARVKTAGANNPNTKIPLFATVSDGVSSMVQRRLSVEKPVGGFGTAFRERAKDDVDCAEALKTHTGPVKPKSFDCQAARAGDDSVVDANNEAALEAGAEGAMAAATAASTAAAADVSPSLNVPTDSGDCVAVSSKQIAPGAVQMFSASGTVTNEKSSKTSNGTAPFVAHTGASEAAKRSPLVDEPIDDTFRCTMVIEPVLFRAPERARSRIRGSSSGIVRAAASSDESFGGPLSNSSGAKVSRDGSRVHNEGHPEAEKISDQQLSDEVKSVGLEFGAMTSPKDDERKSAAAAFDSSERRSQGDVSGAIFNFQRGTFEPEVSKGRDETVPQQTAVVDADVILPMTSEWATQDTPRFVNDVAADATLEGPMAGRFTGEQVFRWSPACATVRYSTGRDSGVDIIPQNGVASQRQELDHGIDRIPVLPSGRITEHREQCLTPDISLVLLQCSQPQETSATFDSSQRLTTSGLKRTELEVKLASVDVEQKHLHAMLVDSQLAQATCCDDLPGAVHSVRCGKIHDAGDSRTSFHRVTGSNDEAKYHAMVCNRPLDDEVLFHEQLLGGNVTRDINCLPDEIRPAAALCDGDSSCSMPKYRERNPDASSRNDMNNNDMDQSCSPTTSLTVQAAPPAVENDTRAHLNVRCASPPEVQRAHKSGDISADDATRSEVEQLSGEYLRSYEVARIIDIDDTLHVERSFSTEAEVGSIVDCVWDQLTDDEDENSNFRYADISSRYSLEPINLADIHASFNDITNSVETSRTPFDDRVTSVSSSCGPSNIRSSPNLKVSRLTVDLKSSGSTSEGERLTSPEVNSRRPPRRRRIVCITHQMAPAE